MEANSVRQDLVTGDLVIEANCDATYCGNPIKVTVAYEDIPGYFEMLNAMEAKDREKAVISVDVHEKMTTLVGLLEMWRDAKARPDYLVSLLEEANEFLSENDPFESKEPK